MSAEQSQFEAMIAPLWDFMNETSARVPVTDWYDTLSGKQMNFRIAPLSVGFHPVAYVPV